MNMWLIPLGGFGLAVSCLGVSGALALVVLILKGAAIFQKAAEPPVQDVGGQYSLDQGRDVGQSQ